MDASALSVQAGVVQPPSINPRVVRRPRPQALDPAELVRRLREGDPVALSKAITTLESTRAADQTTSEQVVELCLPHSGNSVRVGITGVPGVGKSTFIEAFGTLVTSEGHKVAVLTIDPTSQLSGGSILGDKTRMPKLSTNPKAFVRPSPASGSLGGVARRTRETMLICEAAGFDVVLVETVGVGQSEMAVHSMVDCFLLLMLAGAGDELQGIKRGIMEMADLFAITKADGDNMNPARVAKQRYLNALHLFARTASGWIPDVMLCSAVKATGIDEVWATIGSFIEHERTGGYFEHRRMSQAKGWLRETIEAALQDGFYGHPGIRQQMDFMESKVAHGEITARRAAAILLKAAAHDET